MNSKKQSLMSPLWIPNGNARDSLTGWLWIKLNRLRNTFSPNPCAGQVLRFADCPIKSSGLLRHEPLHSSTCFYFLRGFVARNRIDQNAAFTRPLKLHVTIVKKYQKTLMEIAIFSNHTLTPTCCNQYTRKNTEIAIDLSGYFVYSCQRAVDIVFCNMKPCANRKVGLHFFDMKPWNNMLGHLFSATNLKLILLNVESLWTWSQIQTSIKAGSKSKSLGGTDQLCTSRMLLRNSN